MVLRDKYSIRKDLPSDPARWTVRRITKFPVARPSLNRKLFPIAPDRLTKKDHALCATAHSVTDVSLESVGPVGKPLLGQEFSVQHPDRHPLHPQRPSSPNDDTDLEDTQAPRVFVCAGCGNAPGNERCSNQDCQRWYCTRPAGATDGVIGCITPTSGRFVCPACVSGPVMYRYYGAHPQHFAPEKDYDPVLLISILRKRATGAGTADLSAKFERHFAGAHDDRFSRAHTYLGDAGKAMSPPGKSFHDPIRKHMLRFPHSRIVILTEAHADFDSGAFELGKGEFATWTYLTKILGDQSLPFILASTGRKVLTMFTCGPAFTVTSSFKSLQQLLTWGVADIVIGATGPAFIPADCAGPLLDLTFRSIAYPLTDIASHAANVFSHDPAIVNNNSPIYMHRINGALLCETLHLNSRHTAWGFRLPVCRQCNNFTNMKVSYATGVARRKAKNSTCAPHTLPLLLRCEVHKGQRTKSCDMPKGVRAATDDGRYVWHTFGAGGAEPPKWVWRDEDAQNQHAEA